MPELHVYSSWDRVEAEGWDALVADGSPFLEHAFLAGLESLGCAIPETGWEARPVVVREDDGTIVAGAPAWIKTHSMGEFVYDHSWADAARRAGVAYYPKLVVAVPFTPVTGQRLLVRPGADPTVWRRALLAGLKHAAKDTHGLHILFDTPEESQWVRDNGGFRRAQFQFHWRNEGYGSFDDFLNRFKSKTRNKLRRERREANTYDIQVVTAPDAEVLDALHGFYSNTCRNFGPWGRVYLSREFFHHLGQTWGDRLHAVVARDGDRIVAGTFNVIKGDRLYGRYWGAVADLPFLHFECCYYRPIEDAIERGLSVFEPGHGGGHKYTRGFEPVTTWSNHFLVHPGLHEALRQYSEEEEGWVATRVAELKGQSPLR